MGQLASKFKKKLAKGKGKKLYSTSVVVQEIKHSFENLRTFPDVLVDLVVEYYGHIFHTYEDFPSRAACETFTATVCAFFPFG